MQYGKLNAGQAIQETQYRIRNTRNAMCKLYRSLNPVHSMQNTKRGHTIRDTQYGNHSTGHAIRDTQYETRYRAHSIQDTQYGRLNTAHSIQYTLYRTHDKTNSILDTHSKLDT